MTAITLDTDELIGLARYALGNGDLETSLRSLKQAVSGGAAPSEADALLGRVYGQLGLSARAGQHFERYLAAHPDAAHETFELGMTCFERKLADQALDHWRHALTLDPAHPPSLYFSADLLATRQLTQEARAQLNLLMQCAPEDNLYVSQGRALLERLDRLEGGGSFGGAFARVEPYGKH